MHGSIDEPFPGAMATRGNRWPPPISSLCARLLTYAELADSLIPYVVARGFHPHLSCCGSRAIL